METVAEPNLIENIVSAVPSVAFMVVFGVWFWPGVQKIILAWVEGSNSRYVELVKQQCETSQRVADMKSELATLTTTVDSMAQSITDFTADLRMMLAINGRDDQ